MISHLIFFYVITLGCAKILNNTGIRKGTIIFILSSSSANNVQNRFKALYIDSSSFPLCIQAIISYSGLAHRSNNLAIYYTKVMTPTVC
jgi:hypothetical protein